MMIRNVFRYSVGLMVTALTFLSKMTSTDTCIKLALFNFVFSFSLSV